jgi:hypothetical protein
MNNVIPSILTVAAGFRVTQPSLLDCRMANLGLPFQKMVSGVGSGGV